MKRYLRMLWHWDFAVSLLAATAFLSFTLSDGRPLEDAGPAIVASVPLGIAVAAGVLVAYRWTADRIKDDAYGELIRAIDPSEARVYGPHMLVAGAAFGTSLLGTLLLLVQGELGRTTTAISYALLLGIAVYSILGFADLVRLGRRHQKRQALLRSTLEAENRRRRQTD
jgi:hypothetical protein